MAEEKTLSKSGASFDDEHGKTETSGNVTVTRSGLGKLQKILIGIVIPALVALGVGTYLLTEKFLNPKDEIANNLTNSNSETLTEINDCELNPCVNGNCTDEINGYNCTCDAGYYGVNCSTDWYPPGNRFQYKVFGVVRVAQAGSGCPAGSRLAAAGMRNETTRRIIFNKLFTDETTIAWIGLKKSNNVWTWLDGVVWNENNTQFGNIDLSHPNNQAFSCGNCKILAVSITSPIASHYQLCEKEVAD